MKKVRKYSKKALTWLKRNPKYNLIIFAALFGVIGVIALVASKAAGPAISVDLCENSTLQGDAYIGHDHANTSCGHYVSFGYNPPTNVSTALTKVADGVERPVDIGNTGVAGDKRLFILSHYGKIHYSNVDGSNVSSSVFLDLTSKVRMDGNEQGLLGIAFDPNYAQNGYFYVSYNVSTDRGNYNGQNVGVNYGNFDGQNKTFGDRIISRFTRSANDPNKADPNSELVIMGWNQPAPNHNGGDLQFGKDGYLYISSGDGGGGGDNHGDNCSYGNGLCLNTYLGKIMRIDVNGANTSQRYKIPGTNPFVGRSGAKGEIWHYGLRNPWRFSFDRKTGDMYIGDVGQDNWEEIDFAASGSSGKNFGWRCFEGTHTYNQGGGANCSGTTMPIYEYGRGNGCSVTSGYVYRGSAHPEFDGTFIFSDYCNTQLRYLVRNVNGSWSLKQSVGSNLPNIVSFGEDVNGAIYAATLAKQVYRIDVAHQ